MDEITMLIDTSKCIGCKACQAACKQWHSLPVETTTFTGTYTNPPDMSGSTLTVVKFTESRGTSESTPYYPGTDSPQWLFLKDQCRHCFQPKCKRGCPTGVYKTKEGFVLFSANCNDAHVKPRKVKNPSFNPALPVDPVTNPKSIILTFRQHCPYDIPRYSDSASQYVKCDFCYDRFASSDTTLQRDKSGLGISNNHTTACELACPTGAIITGPYDEIIGNSLSYAKKRARVVSKTYHNARLYMGRSGRVGVIYLLTDLPQRYGLASLP